MLFRPRNCLWFGCADRGTDGGVGDSAQGLGGVVLVSVHVNLRMPLVPASTVREWIEVFAPRELRVNRSPVGDE